MFVSLYFGFSKKKDEKPSQLKKLYLLFLQRFKERTRHKGMRRNLFCVVIKSWTDPASTWQCLNEERFDFVCLALKLLYCISYYYIMRFEYAVRVIILWFCTTTPSHNIQRRYAMSDWLKIHSKGVIKLYKWNEIHSFVM